METEKTYLTLDKLKCYRIAFELSNYVWDIVLKWNYFEKDTVGKQYIKAVDSISANIAEGFGRYGKKDKINFYRYARESVMESIDWTEKSNARTLLNDEQYRFIQNILDSLPKSINSLIKYTDTHLAI